MKGTAANISVENELIEINSRWLYVLLALAVTANFSGLFTTILGTDGTLYACIAKTMVLKNDYINLYNEGADWLDKPHLPFWLTALSFKIFGFTNMAYKLPGILCVMLGARYTYLLGKTLYNKTVGLWASLILLTAEHIMISNSDVRAEPYLTGFVITSIYYFYRSYTSKHFYNILLGSLFAAFAVMTKGIFSVIPIVGAIGGELILKKQWKQLFHWRWLFAIVLAFIFIIPELYCLYQQFDLHPEKIIYGVNKVSGLKFFFWDSQFGRFLNTGPIKGKGDVFFFFHTILWAFLPWSLLLYIAFVFIIKRKKYNNTDRYFLCTAGSILTFVVFSLSRFQLPYYLNFIFPLFAIIVAKYIYDLQTQKTIRALATTQKVIGILIGIIACVLYFFLKPDFSLFPSLFVVLLFILMLVFLFGSASKLNILAVSVMCSIFVNVFLNIIIYPKLFKYQSGTEAAKWINMNEPNLPVSRTASDLSYALEFYLNKPLNVVKMDSIAFYPTPFLVYAKDLSIQPLISKNYKVKILKTFNEFHISMLTGKFINNKTRSKELEQYDIVEFY